ncbi:MAG TPA: hypothetical protein VI278_15990 [Nitrososphaeraceae archaeon]|jgi:hypothetical protein
MYFISEFSRAWLTNEGGVILLANNACNNLKEAASAGANTKHDLH